MRTTSFEDIEDDKLKSILHDIKNCILKYYKPLNFIIIGSNKNNIIKNTDIDIITIVEDNVDLELFIQTIAPSIKKFILKYNFYISVYPILNKNYIRKNTQFICNIVNNGIEF